MLCSIIYFAFLIVIVFLFRRKLHPSQQYFSAFGQRFAFLSMDAGVGASESDN